jgi:hypothetical protein
MGSSGQNSVQVGAFWGGYFLGEYLLLEKISLIWISLAYQMTKTIKLP